MEQQIETATKALQENGFEVLVVENSEQAKEKVLSMIPEGSEVMTMTSVTLDSIGLYDAINNSEKYQSVRNKLNNMDRATQGLEMAKLGAAPEYTIGSVHAVTEDGKVLVASNSGSQLPAYSYASPHVIWVVGIQKIVKDLDQGIDRIYQEVLPLESERAHKAYGVPASFVSKLLIINREVQKGRVTLIFVKEKLGF